MEKVACQSSPGVLRIKNILNQNFSIKFDVSKSAKKTKVFMKYASLSKQKLEKRTIRLEKNKVSKKKTMVEKSVARDLQNFTKKKLAQNDRPSGLSLTLKNTLQRTSLENLEKEEEFVRHEEMKEDKKKDQLILEMKNSNENAGESAKVLLEKQEKNSQDKTHCNSNIIIINNNNSTENCKRKNSTTPDLRFYAVDSILSSSSSPSSPLSVSSSLSSSSLTKHHSSTRFLPIVLNNFQLSSPATSPALQTSSSSSPLQLSSSLFSHSSHPLQPEPLSPLCPMSLCYMPKNEIEFSIVSNILADSKISSPSQSSFLPPISDFQLTQTSKHAEERIERKLSTDFYNDIDAFSDPIIVEPPYFLTDLESAAFSFSSCHDPLLSLSVSTTESSDTNKFCILNSPTTSQQQLPCLNNLSPPVISSSGATNSTKHVRPLDLQNNHHMAFSSWFLQLQSDPNLHATSIFKDDEKWTVPLDLNSISASWNQYGTQLDGVHIQGSEDSLWWTNPSAVLESEEMDQKTDLEDLSLERSEDCDQWFTSKDPLTSSSAFHKVEKAHSLQEFNQMNLGKFDKIGSSKQNEDTLSSSSFKKESTAGYLAMYGLPYESNRGSLFAGERDKHLINSRCQVQALSRQYGDGTSARSREMGDSPRKGKKSICLWQFLKELLLSPGTYHSWIRWLDRNKGVFKIEDSVNVARLWGERKNRPAMNYDKLSRSIRQYYKKGIIKKTTSSKRLVYQFCPQYL